MRRVVMAALCVATMGAAVFLLRSGDRQDAPSAGGEPQPNVLLITVDTLRADHVSAYGVGANRTPAIDAMAHDGVRFASAFCDVSWTTPSMASVMTGTYATRHGLRSAYHRLSADNVTLAEVLGEHGYQTGAVIGSFPLDAIYGLDQGFETYDADFSAPLIITGDQPIEHLPAQFSTDVATQMKLLFEKHLRDSRRSDAEVSKVAAQWLRQARTPFFLWVHYFGPHYVPDRRRPRPENVRNHVEEYPQRVAATDQQIKALMLALRESQHAADTLVIFHADHGENLGEHGDVGHGKNLYEPVLHVPLIFWFPKEIPGGRVVTDMARNIDIFPTVLAIVGIAYKGALDGQSLLPALRGNRRIDTADLYAETYMPVQLAFAEWVKPANGKPRVVGVTRRSLRTPDWKFVLTEPQPLIDAPQAAFEPDLYPAREELYDVRHDPAEIENVLTHEPAVAADLRTRLQRYAQQPTHSPADVGGQRDAVHERLRVLGYAD